MYISFVGMHDGNVNTATDSGEFFNPTFNKKHLLYFFPCAFNLACLFPGTVAAVVIGAVVLLGNVYCFFWNLYSAFCCGNENKKKPFL